MFVEGDEEDEEEKEEDDEKFEHLLISSTFLMIQIYFEDKSATIWDIWVVFRSP